jgi:hypothetical protein
MYLWWKVLYIYKEDKCAEVCIYLNLNAHVFMKYILFILKLKYLQQLGPAAFSIEYEKSIIFFSIYIT